MEPNDINLENDAEETAGSEEEVKSGLKIRTNLKAGAITIGSRVSSGHGETMSSGVGAIAPQLELNVLANAVKY